MVPDRAPVTVVTSARPDRGTQLAEAVATVAVQFTKPAAHLIGIDHEGVGGAATKNRLVRAVDSEWVAFLDDDDLLRPDHLKELLAVADGADLVWSGCEVRGREWEPEHHCDVEPHLRAYNFIPVTYLVRRKVYLDAGGMPEGDMGAYDWHFLLRLLDDGARFRCTHAVTWVYRFNGQNHSLGG